MSEHSDNATAARTIRVTLDVALDAAAFRAGHADMFHGETIAEAVANYARRLVEDNAASMGDLFEVWAVDGINAPHDSPLRGLTTGGSR